MKPVSSRYVIRKDSAISYNTKLNNLTNELTDVMQNIYPHVATEKKQFSRYIKEERIKVYRKSKIKFQERQNNEISGTIPLYRSKFWNIGKRREEKEQKRKD